jgi:hypothetical protein
MRRPFLGSLLGAVVIGAAVFAVAWGVQIGALPTPQRAAVIGARVAGWLYRYRRVDSIFSINGTRPARATCVQTWFPVESGGVVRGTLLRLDGRATAITLVPHDLDVVGRHHQEAQWVARAQLELAACPRLLADSIAGADQSAGRIRVSTAHISGRAVLLLHVLARNRRLLVTLSPRNDEPVGLSITAAGGWRGRSVIHLAPVTPALLRIGALRG